MKNAMQLKAIIKNIAKEKGISAQLVLQNFMLERFLERISISMYRDHFILKGGLLIASMVGLDSRATMDMDATIKGLPFSEQSVKDMFFEICKTKLEDDVTFSFISLVEIREGDEYEGYRVSLTANYPPMSVPLKLDITTGDKITPKEIIFEFRLLLEDRTIKVLAYNLETVLAEKLETIISRGDQNTRPRDFYDVYVLYKILRRSIDKNLLKEAIAATSEKRNSMSILENYKPILEVINGSDIMHQRWKNYQKDFAYAKDIAFIDACKAVGDIMK
ncbi:MAG: nucleotidyl transferase AbiEii/AbiGii toxin family protein [Spirochaetaceae bacterium]|jgi:predicted nucleotidyltransferase component of viral defense system|nr:nucleotidyl transferase AbiEii/AbiGii toxin family protein [Spirochaetaceae bacterium]